MALLDQYNSDVRQSPFAGVLRLFSRDTLMPLLTAPKYLFRRTDAELEARSLRIAAQVSAQAGRPTSEVLVEPPRLTSAAIIARLHPRAVVMDAVADDVALTTEDVGKSLDRIEYDLAAIRAEIAPFMPSEPQRPCERRHPYRM